MRRSLALISEGMLSSSTKKALTIASIGWLVGASIHVNPPSSIGGRASGQIYYTDEEKERIELIQIDDANIISVLKIFLECQ